MVAAVPVHKGLILVQPDLFQTVQNGHPGFAAHFEILIVGRFNPVGFKSQDPQGDGLGSH